MDHACNEPTRHIIIIIFFIRIWIVINPLNPLPSKVKWNTQGVYRKYFSASHPLHGYYFCHRGLGLTKYMFFSYMFDPNSMQYLQSLNSLPTQTSQNTNNASATYHKERTEFNTEFSTEFSTEYQKPSYLNAPTSSLPIAAASPSLH